MPDEDAAALHPALAPRLTKIGKERVFVLHWRDDDPANSVFLSQRDVRELQFAKASIATGWQILLRELGVEPEEITQVLLAGSFGAYLTPLAAVRIAILAHIVAQPQTGKFTRIAVRPFDAEQIGPRAQRLDLGGGAQVMGLPAAAALTPRKYRTPAARDDSSPTRARAAKAPCQPNDTETRAMLSPATTAPR